MSWAFEFENNMPLPDDPCDRREFLPSEEEGRQIIFKRYPFLEKKDIKVSFPDTEPLRRYLVVKGEAIGEKNDLFLEIGIPFHDGWGNGFCH
jgi:hypothetical protein